MKLEALRTSKTTVSFYWNARRNIPEGRHRHTCRRESLKCRNNDVVHAAKKETAFMLNFKQEFTLNFTGVSLKVLAVCI